MNSEKEMGERVGAWRVGERSFILSELALSLHCPAFKTTAKVDGKDGEGKIWEERRKSKKN